MKKIISFALSIILILITSACGMALEAETEGPPAATPEVRVVEEGSGIYAQEQIPLPEPYSGCSVLAAGREDVYLLMENYDDYSTAIFRLDPETELPVPTSLEYDENTLRNSQVTPEHGLAFMIWRQYDDGTSEFVVREYDANYELAHEVSLAAAYADDYPVIFGFIPCEGGYIANAFKGIWFVDYEGGARLLLDNDGTQYSFFYNSEGDILACGTTPGGSVVIEFRFDLSGYEKFPQDFERFLPICGWGEDELYIYSDGWLCALDYRTGELQQRVNSDLSSVAINARLSEDAYAGTSSSKLYVSHELPAGTELTVVRLAAAMGTELQDYVKRYNSLNTGSVIEISYYRESEQSRLIAEIAAGNAPDLYDLALLPKELLARRGYLADLGDFVRGLGFAEGVINACTSSDGGIYEFVPCFELMYCAVSEEYVPDGTWTPEDMLGLYEETGLPIFDPSMSRNTFLEYYLAFNGNSYIDGEARFDSAQFEVLLEYASALPERSTTDMNVDLARVYTGQQLGAVEYGDAKMAVTLCMEEGSIPGGCVQLGFPSADGGAVAITSDCRIGVSATTSQREAAEDFLNFVLQNLPYGNTLSSVESDIRTALESKILYWQDYEEMVSAFILLGEGGEQELLEVKCPVPTEADVEAALALINSASVVYDCDDALLDIVTDEAGAFFAGDKSVGDVCANIQDRAEIYIAEQFG